ncbi:hypothetical protein D3C75_1238810 [compost metagenome]
MLTGISLPQAKLAERSYQQAVLTVFVLGVVVEHDKVRQGDGEEVRLDPLAHDLVGPSNHTR